MSAQWITVSDPAAACWRELHTFADVSWVAERIERRFNDRSQRANYRKQAAQIRGALLQAEEYLTTVTHSTLVTAPNSLYYGAQCLATAIMLYRGDGTFALDRLRQDPRNRSHGLRLCSTPTAAHAREGIGLLRNTSLEVQPGGHFFNWHRTLPNPEPLPGLRIASYGSATQSTFEIIGVDYLSPHKRLVGQKYTLLHAAIGLPDLASELGRWGERVRLQRLSMAKCTAANTPDTFKFVIHGTRTQEDLDYILDQFRIRVEDSLPDIDVQTLERGGAFITIVAPPRLLFRYPTVRLRDDGELMLYDHERPMAEFVEAYLLAFGLSMLSRYYPDVWITALDSHSAGAGLTRRFVQLYGARFAMLALSYLSNRPTIFSLLPAPHLRWQPNWTWAAPREGYGSQ